MVDVSSNRLWAGRLTFVALALLVMFVQLLPIDPRPDRWPFPDVLLVGTLAWVARRPDQAPVAVIAVLFLLADLFFQRPPGLFAALVVIATESIRRRSNSIRNIPLFLEWATIGGTIIALTVANRIILAIFMTPQPPLGMNLVQTIVTILAYPLVVGIARIAFGLRRPALGEVDRFGQRL